MRQKNLRVGGDLQRGGAGIRGLIEKSAGELREKAQPIVGPAPPEGFEVPLETQPPRYKKKKKR